MKRVVVVGGGTGNFVVLSGLKQYSLDLSAVVSMADDGGSTGILRDELGVLPPGDVRQCLVALAQSSEVMRSLMTYRFENGGLGGHSFGNLLLSALEKVTGSFQRGVEEISKILSIRGRVIPVTDRQVHLRMVLSNGEVLEGERQIYQSNQIDQGYECLSLVPYVRASDAALQEILAADFVILGPGGLHTSLIPNLLVDGISETICKSKAKKILVGNLMNRRGQTTGYCASHYLQEMERYLESDPFDYLILNEGRPPDRLIEAYAAEGDLVENDLKGDRRCVALDLLCDTLTTPQKGDRFRRSLIRHDVDKLARAVMSIVNHT